MGAWLEAELSKIRFLSSRDGRTRTDDSVSPEHVGLPLPNIPKLFASQNGRI